MDFQLLMKLFVPLLLIVIGLMSKYSSQDGWAANKKLWLFVIITGVISFFVNIYKNLI